MKTPLLDAAGVASLMPYGPEFLFIDELLELHGERRILTRKRYDAKHPLLAAHQFGGRSIVPGAILTEQAAQSALLLGIKTGFAQALKYAYLARVKAEFLAPTVCPAAVDADLMISVLRPTAIGFAASLSVDGAARARVAGVCAFSDQPL